MIGEVLEAIGGFIVGLFVGPAIIFGIGMLVYFFKEGKADERVEEMHREHAVAIKDMKKKYKKQHDRYMKIRAKVIKFVDDIEDKKPTKSGAADEDGE
jgi:uncharacterized protein (DUF1499 family)